MGKHKARRRTARKAKTCGHKVRYGSEMAAMKAGAHLSMDWYRCPFCHGWHLTSKNSQPDEVGK